MVQILPQKGGLAAELGSSIKQGFQQGFTPGMQRGMLQGTLQELNNAVNRPGAKPTDILGPLVLAAQTNPELARSIAPLYQAFSEQLKGQQKAGSGKTGGGLDDIQRDIENRQAINLPGFSTTPTTEQPGMTQPSGEPQAIPRQPLSREDFTTKAAQGLGEQYFPNVTVEAPGESGETFKPQKLPPPPKPIGPAEKRELRRRLRDEEGITDPKLQDQYIEDIINYQKENYDAIKGGYKNLADYQGALKDEDTRFFGQYQDRLNQLTPERQNLWKGLSRLAENAGPDESRYRNTEAMYNQLYEEPLRSFDENTLGLPIASAIRPGEVNERIENARSLAQDHIKSINENKRIPPAVKGELTNALRDGYFTSMVGKDWGTAQAAYAVSNLSPSFKMSINKAPEVKETLADTVYFNGNPATRKKYVDSLAQDLLALKKDDSLVLAREAAIDKNYDDSAFNEALRIAIRNGLKLSNYQRMERPKLELPSRLDLDTIMSGKRSVWDFFKRKK